MKCHILAGSLILLVTLGHAQIQKTEGTISTSFMSNGVKGISQMDHSGRIIKTEVFDSDKKLEYTEIPSYGPDGKITSVTRFDTNGKKIPFQFEVHGANPLGGILKAEKEISDIQALFSPTESKAITAIYFTAKDKADVHVRTELKTNLAPRFGTQIYEVKKSNEKWFFPKDTVLAR